MRFAHDRYASVGGFAGFVLELDRCVMDFEIASQSVVDRAQNRIALRCGDVGNFYMRRKSIVLRPYTPDMQIVHIAHARDRSHGVLDCYETDTARSAFQQNVQGFPHDAGARPQDQSADPER